VLKYSLEIKQSAQKELDALDDVLFTRIDRKILALADNPRPAGCKKLKGYQDPKAHASGSPMSSGPTQRSWRTGRFYMPDSRILGAG